MDDFNRQLIYKIDDLERRMKIQESNEPRTKFPLIFPFNPAVAFPMTANGNPFFASRPDNAHSLYLIEMDFSFRVLTTFDANNYWDITFNRLDSTTTSTAVFTYTTWQTGRTPGTQYVVTVSINATHVLNDAFAYFIGAVKAGAGAAPGSLVLYPPILWLRAIG